MDTLVEFLHHNSDLGKTMFYPGSYEDFGMIETFTPTFFGTFLFVFSTFWMTWLLVKVWGLPFVVLG